MLLTRNRLLVHSNREVVPVNPLYLALQLIRIMHNYLKGDKVKHANTKFTLEWGRGEEVEEWDSIVNHSSILCQHPIVMGTQPSLHLPLRAMHRFLLLNSEGQGSHHLSTPLGPHCCTLRFSCSNTDRSASSNWKWPMSGSLPHAMWLVIKTKEFIWQG